MVITREYANRNRDLCRRDKRVAEEHERGGAIEGIATEAEIKKVMGIF